MICPICGSQCISKECEHEGSKAIFYFACTGCLEEFAGVYELSTLKFNVKEDEEGV